MFKFTHAKVCFFALMLHPMLIFSKHFVLISAPGSGKGTFSQYMVKTYGYVHVGAGDICRQRIAKHLSVEPDILIKILKKNIVTAIESNQNFILDNAIGSEYTFQYWKSFFKKHNITNQIYFIVLQASDQTCIDRIKHRLVCTKCFNVDQKKAGSSSKNQRCSQCAQILSVRDEDHDYAFLKKRFQRYHQIINPIIKQIEQSFHVITISSEQSLETLYSIYDELHNL